MITDTFTSINIGYFNGIELSRRQGNSASFIVVASINMQEVFYQNLCYPSRIKEYRDNLIKDAVTIKKILQKRYNEKLFLLLEHADEHEIMVSLVDGVDLLPMQYCDRWSDCSVGTVDSKGKVKEVKASILINQAHKFMKEQNNRT